MKPRGGGPPAPTERVIRKEMCRPQFKLPSWDRQSCPRNGWDTHIPLLREGRAVQITENRSGASSPPGTGGVARSAGVVAHRQSLGSHSDRVSVSDHPVRSFKGCFTAFSLGRVHPSCSRRGAASENDTSL